MTGPVDAFGGIPVEDRAHVLRTAVELVPEVQRAIRAYPIIFGDEAPTASRVNGITLAWVAKCPDADRRLIIDMATLYLLTLALDDVMDGVVGDFSVAQLEMFIDDCVAVVRDPSVRVASERAAGPLRHVVAGFRDSSEKILSYPPSCFHHPYFATLMRRSFAGMVQDLHWQRGLLPWPSYADYIRDCSSALASTIVGALLATLGPLSPVHVQRPQLDAAAQHTDTFIRLVNDLRSMERDRSHNVPNAVLILSRDLALSETAAAEEILRRAGRQATVVEDVLDRLPPELERAPTA